MWTTARPGDDASSVPQSRCRFLGRGKACDGNARRQVARRPHVRFVAAFGAKDHKDMPVFSAHHASESNGTSFAAAIRDLIASISAGVTGSSSISASCSIPEVVSMQLDTDLARPLVNVHREDHEECAARAANSPAAIDRQLTQRRFRLAGASGEPQMSRAVVQVPGTHTWRTRRRRCPSPSGVVRRVRTHVHHGSIRRSNPCTRSAVRSGSF